MPLQYLHDTCQGQELTEKLRQNWPNCFAISEAQQKLCAGLEVMRWIISVLAESGSPMITIDPTDTPLLLAVANYPIQSTVRDMWRRLFSDVSSQSAEKKRQEKKRENNVGRRYEKPNKVDSYCVAKLDTTTRDRIK